MGIFSFGDVIPSGPDTDYFVSYNVDGIPGGMLDGPHKSYEIADEHRKDIAGFEGVSNAKIIKRTSLK